jgi:hypothetical protein
VQEQSAGATTTNLLTGGLDELFLRAGASGPRTYLTDAVIRGFALVHYLPIVRM